MVFDAKCRCCVLASNCLLAPPDDASQLTPRQIEFKKGGIIYSPGFPAESVFVVRRGSVSLALTDQLGKGRIVRFVRAGQIFGLDTLLPAALRVFGAVAREQTTLCFASRTTFIRFMRHDGHRIWSLLLALNSLVHEDGLEKMAISGQPAKKRLQIALARFGGATSDARPIPDAIEPIKQWELAQFLGMSAETVSRQMKELRARCISSGPRRV